MTTELMKMCEALILKNGNDFQTQKFIEECAEAIVAISHFPSKNSLIPALEFFKLEILFKSNYGLSLMKFIIISASSGPASSCIK